MPRTVPARLVAALYAVAVVLTAGLLATAESGRMDPHAALLALLMVWVPLGYGLPTLVAVGRRHRHWYVILIANVVVGFTGFGWLFCLAAALGFVRVPKRMRLRS